MEVLLIMLKIHLLLKKEDIDRQKMLENKVAVVFDILLATSTVTSALEFGAKEIIPVLDGAEAQAEAKGRTEGSYVLVGEYQGKTIDGFLSPNPLELKEKIQGKTVILSTTNGTVALKNSSGAKAVYSASILNSRAVADHILKDYKGETIIVVCSGSSNEFNVEDFFGAGYFIDCLTELYGESANLTDPAFAAHQFYRTNKENGADILKRSRVGQMLSQFGFEKEIEFISQESLFEVVPFLIDKKRIVPVRNDSVYI
jgi:2-phosphosulfolactate phosphatase